METKSQTWVMVGHRKFFVKRLQGHSSSSYSKLAASGMIGVARPHDPFLQNRVTVISSRYRPWMAVTKIPQ